MSARKEVTHKLPYMVCIVTTVFNIHLWVGELTHDQVTYLDICLLLHIEYFDYHLIRGSGSYICMKFVCANNHRSYRLRNL